MLAAGKQAGIHRVTQTDLDYLSGLQNGSADDPCSLSIVRRGFRAISIGKSNSPSIVVDEPFGCRSIDRCQRRWWWFEFKRRLGGFRPLCPLRQPNGCALAQPPLEFACSWRPHPFRTTTAALSKRLRRQKVWNAGRLQLTFCLSRKLAKVHPFGHIRTMPTSPPPLRSPICERTNDTIHFASNPSKEWNCEVARGACIH